ncbi:hypothetical protein RM572_19855 [Streptomyces sp. DSM 42041]|uniref:DUF3592 domain-containing protein n=1 Tax=Streptomyces hazeniae TaxID=3075538 RepID=A0ABU2NVK1_9ACTN|nr:hypothetical protein [Streptomyces sp. DSM 42041]MDT0381013.1 hypothetical protein [Streptomyces sp. DSM 42041]
MNAPDGGGESAVRRAVTLGRVVGALGTAALAGQAAAWLCVGDPALRSALTWWCAGALVLCFAAVLLVQVSARGTDVRSAYRAAWRLGVGGAPSRRWQAVVPALVGPAYLALLVGLGASALQEAGDAEKISAAGARIVAAPVEAVDPQGKTGKGRYDDYRAVYDVRLPVSGVGGAEAADGRSVRVEVLSSAYLGEGDTLYVAYAPEDLGLRPVADEERSQLEQELAGLPLTFRAWVAVLVAWGAGTLWLAFRAVRGAAGFRAESAAGTPVAVPVAVDGHVQHATAPDGPPGLLLRGDGVEMPFEPAGGSVRAAAAALQGQQGSVLWEPAGEGGDGGADGKAPAVFVAAEGRRLHGSVAVARCRDVEARGQARAVASQASGGRDVDFGPVWPLATRPGVLGLFFLAYALLTPLFVLPHSGGWGVACGVASAAAVGAGFLSHWNRAE